MKILYFYQYFSTPKGSWGTRVYEYTKEWIERGHDVTVVTSIYSKSDLKTDKLIDYREIEGIKLIILNIKIDNKQHSLMRIWTFIQYSFLASWFAVRESYDVVISSSGPITVGIPGLVGKIIKRKKMVFEVRDLWPDTAISMGFIQTKAIQKMMYAFEKFCYNNSDLIVTLSPGSKENIINRYKKYNIISIPNSANIKLFQNRGKALSKEFAKQSYAIYTGNIGPVNNSYLLFEAAKILKEKNCNDIKIILIGDGQQKDELKAKAEDLNLENQFMILDLMPKEDLVPFVQNSLASLIPLASKPLLDTSSPNKLFESLAAGVPIIQTTKGWIKDLLYKEECGFTVSSENSSELVDKLIELKNNEGLRFRLCENSYRVAREKFDKKMLAQEMIENIEVL